MVAAKTYFLSDAHATSPGDGAIHDAALAMLGDAGWISVHDPKFANCVIIGGGGTLYGRHNEQRYGDSLQHSLHTIRAATCLNNGGLVCAFGSGCQGFECTDDHKMVWSRIIKQSGAISMRDQESIKWITEDLNIDASDVKFSAHGDISFFWDPGSNDTIALNRILVGVNPLGLSDSENKALLDSLREMTALGYDIIWYPFESNGLCECLNACQEIGAKTCMSIDMADFSDWTRYMYMARTSAITVSNRLHGLLMGVMSRRPVIPIINARKVEAQETHLFGNEGAPFKVCGNFDYKDMMKALHEAIAPSPHIIDLYDTIAKREQNSIRQHVVELERAFETWSASKK